MSPRLAVILSHPIQYHSPMFKYLAKHMDMHVFYFMNPNEDQVGQQGFGQSFSWDIDLLDGYEYTFLNNRSQTPSVSDYSGCDVPDIGQALLKENITHAIIYGWYLKAHWQAFHFCRKNGIKVAVRGDSQIDPREGLVKGIAKKIYYPRFIKKYDAYMVVGKRNARYLKKFGAKDEQIIHSPHAIDQEFWRSDSQRNPANEGKVKFLWVAKFIEKKRPIDTIKAFIMAAENDSDIELTMVGSGMLLEECKAVARDHPRIEFPGFKNQTELRNFYHQSDCLILSSDYGETWGLVVNEAFASGMPAIVSDACGCVEDMIDNHTGRSYPLGDTNALAHAMGELAATLRRDPSFFKEGIASKNKIYSYEKNALAFKKFLSGNGSE